MDLERRFGKKLQHEFLFSCLGKKVFEKHRKNSRNFLVVVVVVVVFIVVAVNAVVVVVVVFVVVANAVLVVKVEALTADVMMILM